MAEYYVQVAYRTKRSGVCLGMHIDAFGPDEAEREGLHRALDGYPARKLAWCKVSEAGSNKFTITLPSDVKD